MSISDTSLKSFNTFSLEVNAAKIVTVDTVDQLVSAWNDAKLACLPVLLLGEGSNVLFLEDFAGVVILNRIKGIVVTDECDCWSVHVGAGENWHHLVRYTLDQQITGLENLAMIPGCVGSAPIQNIGAYGVELQSVCQYVDLLDLNTGIVKRIDSSECQFGYRESIFKHHYRDGYAIVAVGFRLNKKWNPVLTYGDLVKLDRKTVTAQQVFAAVCAMRSSKLPDPRVTGNAGSFFKNPIVEAEKARFIKESYPKAPLFEQPDGSVKLAAGWLIDQCELKGFRIGGAAVHQQQALVLINVGNATSRDIRALARHVRVQVAEKFAIWLEPEVRFISSHGEVNAVEALS
jgi:UDP-N-acetylmuramate dehydrogenase